MNTKPLADALVLSRIGMMAMLDRLAEQAVKVACQDRRIFDLEREVRHLQLDNRDLERRSDLRTDAYHHALIDHRELLKKRGVKAKYLPVLPPTWEADAKRIASETEIPF